MKTDVTFFVMSP